MTQNSTLMMSLEEAKAKYPKLIKLHADDYMLDCARVIVVPKGVMLNHAIEVKDTASTLIIAMEGAVCRVQQEYDHFHHSANFPGRVIIVAHSNSDITYIGRTNCNGGVLDLMVSAEKDARIQTLLMSTGLGFAKSFASFDGPGACIEQSFLHTGKDKDSCALSAELFHEAPNTKGSIEVRGILRDQARSNIQGMIRVVDTATGTKSELVERVLLLSDKARCDAVPGLDILTDDVQVSHSASVKQADKEQLFYLMSRGLDEAAARQLIVDGFFEGLLGKFGVEI